MTQPKLDPERIYQAIREGVSDAVWAMITNATSAPCKDFYASVEEGIKAAMMELNRPEKEQ